jgi:putative transposase
MSRKGNCLENGAMEAFFSHLKAEWIHIQNPLELNDFRAGLTEYLQWWNSTRMQQRLGYLSPQEYWG